MSSCDIHIIPPPRADTEHSVVHLRDRVAGSALKNNQKSQTPALALWPMWPAGPEAWEVASPRALLQASRPFCRAPGMGRGWSHLAVSKEMPSPPAVDMLELGSYFSGNCPSKSYSAPTHNRHTCLWTHKTCPGMHSHTHSPTPTSGNLGGFLKETETLTLQMLTQSPGQSSCNEMNSSTLLLLNCCTIHL